MSRVQAAVCFGLLMLLSVFAMGQDAEALKKLQKLSQELAALNKQMAATNVAIKKATAELEAVWKKENDVQKEIIELSQKAKKADEAGQKKVAAEIKTKTEEMKALRDQAAKSKALITSLSKKQLNDSKATKTLTSAIKESQEKLVAEKEAAAKAFREARARAAAQKSSTVMAAPAPVPNTNNNSMTLDEARAIDETLKKNEAALKEAESQQKRLKAISETLTAQMAKLQAEQKQRQAKAKDLEKTAETLAEDLKQLNTKAEKAQGAEAEKLQADIKAAKQKLQDTQAAAKTETQGAEQVAKSLIIFEKRQKESLAREKGLAAQIARLKAQTAELQAKAKLATPILAAEKEKRAALEAIVGIPAAAADQSLNWMINDSGGFRWDITRYGSVADGTSDAYDNGLILKINNQQFSGVSSTGKLDRANNELFLQPQTLMNLKVLRRIRIDTKGQYARWIDLFENPTSQPITVSLEYYSNLGTSLNLTEQIGQSDEEEDNPNDLIGLAAGSNSSSSRPFVVGIYGLREAKTKLALQFQRNSDNIYARTQLTVPAGKIVGICLFQMQRRGLAAASQAMREFPIEIEYEKIPDALRGLIVNFAEVGMSLGSLKLPRDKKTDLLVDRQGNRLNGQILNDAFTLQTDFGPVTLPAKTVLGLDVVSATQLTRIGLANGQIICGEMEKPIRFKLANGKEESFFTRQLQAMGYRVSPEKPNKLTLTKPMIQLLDGATLIGPKDMTLNLLTEHGLLKLNGDMLKGIQRNTAGGADLVTFRSGGKLAGLWTGPVIKFKTDFGPDVAISKNKVAAILWPGKKVKPAELSKLTLKNGDVLYGKLTGKPLIMLADSEPQPIGVEGLASITLDPEKLGIAAVKYYDGKTMAGKLQNDAVVFDIGIEKPLSLYPGHILSMTFPKPKPKSQPKPVVRPAAKSDESSASQPTTQPAATAEANLKKFIPALLNGDGATLKAICEAPMWIDGKEMGTVDEFCELAAKRAGREKVPAFEIKNTTDVPIPDKLKEKDAIKDAKAILVIIQDGGREHKVFFFVNPKTGKIRGFDD